MSSAAISGGGSIAAGSIVAVLQSAGVLGVGTAATLATTAATGTAAGFWSWWSTGTTREHPTKSPMEEEGDEDDQSEDDSGSTYPPMTIQTIEKNNI